MIVAVAWFLALKSLLVAWLHPCVFTDVVGTDSTTTYGTANGKSHTGLGEVLVCLFLSGACRHCFNVC